MSLALAPVPRLMAARAVLSKAKIITARLKPQAEGGKSMINFKGFPYVDYWESMFRRLPDVQLFVAAPPSGLPG
jgi:hypothetical protein